MVNPLRSEGRCDPYAAPDPVAAVLMAHTDGLDVVLRTSGTSSSAHAVVRSTASWWSSFSSYTALSGVDRRARLWLPGPLGTTMNLFAAVHARVVGAELVARPGEATHACLTPAALYRHADTLPAGARVVVGGDRLAPAAWEIATAQRLVVTHYYGAAELSFVAAGRHGDDLRAFPGVEVRIAAGEIQVRSRYLARPGSGSLRLSDGWATVGDRGKLNGDRLVVLGRDGTVMTAGTTVVLAEVEEHLAPVARGPYALVGLPHAHLGAVLAAVVTSVQDQTRLRDHARTHLPTALRPRVWRVVDQLPLTAAGKVDRVALSEMFVSHDRGAR